MTGTLVNTGAVVAGSLLGVMIGKRLPDRVKTIVMQALGLSVVLIGLQMALSGTRPLLVIGSLLLGAVTGELMDIEGRIAVVGEWLKRRFRSESSTFVQGFRHGLRSLLHRGHGHRRLHPGRHGGGPEHPLYQIAARRGGVHCVSHHPWGWG